MNYSTTLTTAATLACCVSSVQAASISALTLTGATLEGQLVPDRLISFTPGTATDEITTLISNNFTVSTTSTIQGDLNLSDQMITLYLDDWILSGNGTTSQTSGGVATGDWDGDVFTVSWRQQLETPLISDANLDLSRSVFWTLSGTAQMSAVPVPAALWLFGSGIVALSRFKRQKIS